MRCHTIHIQVSVEHSILLHAHKGSILIGLGVGVTIAQDLSFVIILLQAGSLLPATVQPSARITVPGAPPTLTA